MEIIQTLQSMLKNTMAIQNMDLPTQTKDNARNVMNQSLNMVLDQTHPRKINQIIMNELRKKHNKGNIQ